VWPWLAGPFFAAKLKFAEDPEKAFGEAKAWLDRFSVHLKEAGLGQVSEIFDGDEPHHSRGCIAQAWSVAELLRLAKTVSRRSNLMASHREPPQTESRALARAG
jgi:glycogen debranching enzyme